MGNKLPKVVAASLGMVSSRQSPDDRRARMPERFLQRLDARRQPIEQPASPGPVTIGSRQDLGCRRLALLAQPDDRATLVLPVEPAKRRRPQVPRGPAGSNQPSACRTNDCTTTSPRWASMTTETSVGLAHAVGAVRPAMASSVLMPKTSAPTA